MHPNFIRRQEEEGGAVEEVHGARGDHCGAVAAGDHPEPGLEGRTEGGDRE